MCYLLSHGNTVPERGFSMNKILLECHSYTIDNDITAALRLVKNSIRKEGGLDKFPITRKVLNYSFESYAKYQKHHPSKGRKDKRKKISNHRKKLLQLLLRQKKQKLEVIWNEIEKCKLPTKSSLMVTEVLH